MSQVRTFFFLFGLWLRKGLEPKKTEISVRCDLAAFSSGLRSARAGPTTLTEVPGMMLAWLSEDADSLTFVVRRGRVEVALRW